MKTLNCSIFVVVAIAIAIAIAVAVAASSSPPQPQPQPYNLITKTCDLSLRRERIDERMKALQELVSSINKDEPPSERKIAKLCEYAAKKSFLDSKGLKNLKSQLYSAVEYFELSYTNDDQKQIYVETLKDYAVPKILEIHVGPLLTLLDTLS
ncbi:hypothetical protein AHAS_Ahas17G0131000 [Arachis hypogaea]